MNRIRHRILTVVAATLIAGAMIFLLASPAFAVATSCAIPTNQWGCSTRSIPAHPTGHGIVITAYTATGLAYPHITVSVTCRAHDAANGIEVGQVTATAPISRPRKVIYGLYGNYYLSCLKTVLPESAGGGGSISDGR